MKNFLKLAATILLGAFGITASAATLSLSPATSAINVGSNFTVNVALNTEGAAIDGVDVFYLNFNPSLLSVVDTASGASGVQITAGSLMPNTIVNTVDNATGKITFSQVPNGGSTYTGSGNLASITFNAKAAGTANVTFDFTSGSTLDSNIASNGSDVLTAVTNGSYTLSVPVVVVPPVNPPVSTPPVSTPPAQTSGNTGGSSSSSGGGGSSSGGSGSSGTRSSSGVSGGTSSNTQNTVAVKGNISKNLSFRSEGADVLLLQKFLVAQGLLTADNQTGFFGRVTEAALQNFQKKIGIVSAGTVETTGFGAAGPATRQVINSIIGSGTVALSGNTTVASAPVVASVLPASGRINTRLALKSEGSEVLLLQKVLVQQKLLTADNQTGYFGPLTEAALKQFQKIYGIVTSGTPASTGYGAVGPKTREFLNTLLSN